MTKLDATEYFVGFRVKVGGWGDIVTHTLHLLSPQPVVALSRWRSATLGGCGLRCL